MNIWEIAKKVGSSALRNVIPGASAVLDIVNTVNEFLPGNKLSEQSTGDELAQALNGLPNDQRAELLTRKFDVIIEEHRTLQTMLTADATSSHTTRPWIAKWSFVFTAIFSGTVGLIIILTWAYAVYKGESTLIKSIMDGWPFVLAVMASVTGTFTILLKAYFGLLTTESEQKIGGATGNFKPSAIGNIISAIRGK